MTRFTTIPMVMIGVIGHGTHDGAGPLEPHVGDVAEEVGRLIAERGAVTVTGGEGGVMASAARGAIASGGLTLGILRGTAHDDGNPYLSIALPTGLGRARNLLLARGCDALVMVGGGAGTLNEVTIAYAEGTPIVIVRDTGGWADRLPDVLIDGTYLDERRTTAIDVRDDANEAVTRAFARITDRRGRRGG